MRLADPRRALVAVLAGATATCLATTGEVTLAALVAAAAAVAALAGATVPERASRPFELASRIVFVLALAYFAWCVLDLRLLAGAIAITLPIQVYCLVKPPTEECLSRLQLVTFLQLVGLSAATTTLLFLPLLLLWLVLAPAILTLAALEKSSQPAHRRLPLPLPPRLLAAGAGAGLACLLVGAVIFLIVPRYEAGLMKSLSRGSLRMSGFTEEVSLGDISRIQTSDAIAMRVAVEGRPPEPLLWRGIAFDSFTGHSWIASRPDWAAAFGWQHRPRPAPQGARTLVQEYRLESMSSRVLFHVPQASAIDTEFPVGVERDRFGNLRHVGAGRGRIKYRVVSHVGVPWGLELGDEDRARFLQLPDELDGRVAGLASEITRQAATPAEKAQRVQAHLRRWHDYTLDVNDRGRDPVGRFLLERRAGHCEYFASAMAVLLREVGVPARVVNGFRPGTYSRLFRVFVVRQRDAHSWVEAWLPGQGWTTFDPTPPSASALGEGGLGAPREIWRDVLIFWDDSVIGFNYTYQLGAIVTLREWASAARASLRAAGPESLLWLAVAVLLAASLVALRRIRRKKRDAPAGFAALVLRILARRGYPRRPGQTPEEVAREAVREGGEPGRAALELTRLYYASRFGGHAVDRARVALLLARLEDLPPRHAGGTGR